MGLTNNYWNAMKVFVETVDIPNGAIDYNGNAKNVNKEQNQFVFTLQRNAFTLSLSDRGWVVGTGDSAEAKTDYALASQITSGISGSVVSITGGVIITVVNSGSSDITIKEIGYREGVSASGYTSNNCLVYRKVLDTPVALAVGDSCAIRVNTTFTAPN